VGFSISALQPPQATLAIFPGAERSAVEIQARLKLHSIQIQLVCLDTQVAFIQYLGSQCRDILSFPAMSQRVSAGQIDFFIAALFTPEDMGRFRLILQDTFVQMEGKEGKGVVGAGDMFKIHIVTLPSAGIKTINDLDDKKNSTGPENSIHDLHAHDVFEAEELGNALRNRLHNELRLQPDLLLGREIDAFFETARVPSPHVARIAEYDDLTLIAIPEDTVERMNNLEGRQNHPYIPTEIEISEYEKDSDEKIPTGGVTELVSTSAQLPSEFVIQVTEILIGEPLVPEDDLARIFTWVKEQGFPIHPDAAPIIEAFLQEQSTPQGTYR
jgi:hypothetical protein